MSRQFSIKTSIKNILCMTLLSFFSSPGFAVVSDYWSSSTSTSLTANAGTLESRGSDRILTLDEASFRKALNTKSKSSINGSIVYFPNSTGEIVAFDVKEKSNFSPILAAKFPEISAFIGTAVNDSSLQIRFSLAPSGIDAAINSSIKPEGTAIEKIEGTNLYSVSSNSDSHDHHNRFSCSTEAKAATSVSFKSLISTTNYSSSNSNQGRFSNDSTLSKYRLAVSANGQYTQYHGGSVAGALAGINATLTNVNAIFERDFGITLELIDNNDLIIYTDAATDPYTDSTELLNGELQANLDIVIGSANYDHGHIFSAVNRTTMGGNAGAIGGFCNDETKGSAWSDSPRPEGSDFTFLVAHEMGHQLGANHTFSMRSEGKGKNVEPGSGTTVMSYAGITGGNNVAIASDDYFHHVSIEQSLNYLQGQSCHVDTPNENHLPIIENISDFTIPVLTPFILSGKASDADDTDLLSYTWEQIDDGTITNTNFSPKNASGAAFRSLPPSGVATRYMPKLSSVLAGNLTLEDPDVSSSWETLSSVPRDLNFGFTVRDNALGGGGVTLTKMKVSVVDSDGAFSVRSPANGLVYFTNTLHTVAWNVAGTNLDPMLADKVTITLSVDGGLTFPYTLASNVDNDGSHAATLPDFVTSKARVRIEPNNSNIFYAINTQDFSITRDDIILSTDTYEYEVCSSQTTDASLVYGTSPKYSDIAVLSATGLPNGLSVEFSPPSVSADDTLITAAITAAANIVPGTYSINVNATSDSRTQSLPISIRAYSSEFSPVQLLTPQSSSVLKILRPTLTWEADFNNDQYLVEVAKDTNFSEVLFSSVTTQTSLKITGLLPGLKYYWRVSPLNNCGVGPSGAASSFFTSDATYLAPDLPVDIVDEIGRVDTSTISILENHRITDINVLVDLTFNDISQLEISLTSPFNETITLKKKYSCQDSADISITFDDQAESFNCNASSARPEDGYLHRFNELSTIGDWVLSVSTGYGSNAQGKINVFALEITTDADYENYPPIAFDQRSYVKAGEETIIPLRAIDPEGRSLSYQLNSPSAGLLEIFSAKKLGAYEEKDSFGEGISVDLVLANSESYAFTVGENLSLLDISDPSNIVKLAEEEFQDENPDCASGNTKYSSLTLTGDEALLFIARGHCGVSIYHVAEPTNIIFMGVYETPYPYSALEVVLSSDEKLAFVSVIDYSGEQDLHIVDISDPSNPLYISAFGTSSYALHTALSADGNTAFIVDGNYLSSVDITDSALPQLISYIPMLDNLGTRLQGLPYALVISADGQRAYIASKGYGLVIFDISDSNDMMAIGNIFLDPVNDAFSIDGSSGSRLILSPDETTIYFAVPEVGVKVIDVRNPQNLILVDTIPANSPYAITASAKGDRLYISNQIDYDDLTATWRGGDLEVYEAKKQKLSSGSNTLPYVYYTSSPDSPDSDSFSFKATDGELDSNNATISISINSDTDVLWSYFVSSDNTVTITGCASTCPSNLVIPPTIVGLPITAIANHAFAASSITSISLPGSIITIGDYAFYRNLLKTITIKANITNIGVGAFSYNSIIVGSFLGDRPNIGVDAFKLNRDLAVISYCQDQLGWPGIDFSNGLTKINPTKSCNAAESFTKIVTAALDSDITSLVIQDLEALVGIKDIDANNLDSYLAMIRLSSAVSNVSAIQSFISSVNATMSSCPTTAYFMSVGNSSPYPEDISWTLSEGQTNKTLFSGGVDYLNFTCLTDGRYTLNMYDSYGDGWDNGYGEVDTFFSLHSADGIEIAKEGLAAGYFGDANINLGNYLNQAPTASSQNLEVVRDVPSVVSLLAADGDLDPFSRRLTKVPTTGSIYQKKSIETLSIFKSEFNKLYDIAISDSQNIAYLAHGTLGLSLINITDPAAISQISSLDTDGLARGVTLSADENTVFLADGTLGLKIIDVSDSRNPSLVSAIVVGESIYDIALSQEGDFAYVAHLSGLSRVDISDLKNPAVVGTVLSPGDAQTIALSENNQLAYLGDGYKGFHVIDIGQPESLSILNSLDTDGEIYSIAISSDGSYLYVADGSYGLKVFDIQNTDNFKLISSVTNIGSVTSVKASSDGFTLYLATSQSTGPVMLDISDISNPVLIKTTGDSVVNHIVPSLDESNAYAITSDGLEVMSLNYNIPYVVNDSLSESIIYLSKSNDNNTDSFEFVANDGRTDSAPGIINLTILNDVDGDRVADKYDAFPNNLTESVDTDGDGIGNNADPDDDGDSVNDLADGYPLISLNGLLDSDGDGIPNICDASCILAGMTEDKDDDDDGVADDNDLFPLDSTETIDSDLDGTGNNADPDDDNDGVLDASDDYPLNSIYSKDSDNDGMPDAWETRYGLNPNDPSDAISDQDNDGVSAIDEFLAGTVPSGSLDVDGNENYDALTDGLLLLRGMFGLDGSALVTGTIASNAAYTESVDIEARIATLGDLADIDGNGQIDALTDGLLILRYLFGLEGDTLIKGVIAADATRTTSADIEAHLQTLMPN
jgi:subtilisin-like proprotein convertase family protein